MNPYTHCPFCTTKLVQQRSNNFVLDEKCIGCTHQFKQWTSKTNNNDILLMFSTSRFRFYFHLKDKALDTYRLSPKFEKIFTTSLPSSFLDNITNHDYLDDKINKLIIFS